MADGTKIEWADATVNYVNGCSLASPGCTNCYAMRLAGTRLKHHPTRAGLTQDTKAGPVWTGEVRENPAALEQVLRWKKPRAIFWNAHGDLFHENVPDEWIDKQFAVMALTPQHRHMVLTKRSARMRAYLSQNPLWNVHLSAAGDIGGEKWGWIADRAPRGSAITQYNLYLQVPWPLTNVWLGVSVEDQRRADERIPDLLETPAAIRFISAEPLLGPVDLTMLHHDGITNIDALRGMHGVAQPMQAECDKIQWVIVGGESGPGARPMHPDWARSLRDQCGAAGVPFHFKQWGEWGPDVRADRHQKTSDGYDRDRVMEGVARCAVWNGGDRWTHYQSGYGPTVDEGHGEWVYRLGKRLNGRLLDGIQHDGAPA